MAVASLAPKTVRLFAPADAHALEIAAVMDVFHEANAQSGHRLYDLSVVAEESAPIRSASGLAVAPDFSIAEAAGPADTLVIGGTYGVPAQVSQRVSRWLAVQAGLARRYGSVCTGAFLLGEAGLIDGRRVTTHWRYAGELATRFPRARVESDCIFLRDGALFTSAGVTAALDLALELVEEDYGRDLALRIARQMVMYIKRPGGQSQYSVRLATQVSESSPLARVQTWAQEHPHEDLSVPALASRAAMSPRNFSRVFRAETGVTPAEFVERLRIDVARRLLEEGQMSLEQVARASGLGSSASARRVFLRRFGVTLKQYRERFHLDRDA